MEAFLRHIEVRDPHLHRSVREIPMVPLTRHPDYFQYLLRAIAFQQLSGKAGATIHGRFVNLFEDAKPTPGTVLDLPLEQLRGAGLSGQKSAYMQNIARFWLEEGLDNRTLDQLEDEELLKLLTRIKGVGHWTVEILMIFGMLREDVFPLDDLGIQQGVAGLYRLEEMDTRELKKEMLRLSENWRPYRSVASRYIWAWKDSR